MTGIGRKREREEREREKMDWRGEVRDGMRKRMSQPSYLYRVLLNPQNQDTLLSQQFLFPTVNWYFKFII